MLVSSVFFAGSAWAGAGDVVNNPGSSTFTANGGGFLDLAGKNTVLPSTATPTQCNDGVNNDVAVDDPTKAQDTNIDFDGGASHGVIPATPVDAQCNAGGGFTAAQDDSEIAAGNQPRAYITGTGTVDKDGNVAIPAASFVFPKSYVYAATGGALTIVPAATSPVTGTLNPATGLVNLHVNWQLELQQAFFHIDCASQISMDLSSDAANATNGGAISVAPVAYNTSTGAVTLTSNIYAVPAMVPVGVVTRTTGAATSGSAVFTDSSAPFKSTDVGRSVTIFGAGPSGTDLTAQIKTFTNTSTVTLSAAAGTTVSPATWTLADSSQTLCNAVNTGFGLPAASGASAVQLSFNSSTVFIPGAVVANTDTGSTPFNTALVVPAPGVLANDTGTGNHVTGHTNPSHGSVSIASDGSYTYTPASTYWGEDSFTYTVTDGFGHTATATVALTVGLPPAPVATDDSYSTAYNTPLSVAAPGVLGNDTGTGLTVTSFTQPTPWATVNVAVDGSLTFTPSSSYAGPLSFTYTVTDALARTSTATVHVKVNFPQKPTGCVGAWQLNGSATAGSFCEAALTQAGPTQQAGTAFFPVAQPSTNIRKISFDVKMGLGTGADGVVLFFGDASKGATATSVGQFGGYLGVGGDALQAIPGVGVSLDTYKNGGDISSNFVGFVNGSHLTGPVPGVYYTKQADLPSTPLRNSSAKVITHVEVTVAGGWVTSVAVNGTTVLTGTLALPPSVFIGFGSSTGLLTDFHSVYNVVTTIN